MEIYVGASNHTALLKARKWVDVLDKYPRLFSELQHWTLKKEPELGECRTFIEISLPPPRDKSYLGPHSQIDMLICFSKWLAFCEMKSTSSIRGLKIEELVDQIEGQSNHLEKLLKESGFRPESISEFLFVPEFSRQDLERTKQKLRAHAAYHIWPSGSQSDPYDLPVRLENRLKNLKRLMPEWKPGLQDLLKKKLSEDELKLCGPFKHFDEAKAHLERFVMPSLRITFDAGFVEKLRPAKLEEAIRTFTNNSILEIVGPPGIGKSCFVKELLREIINKEPSAIHPGMELVELRMSKCLSLHDVCHQIQDTLSVRADSLGDETFIQQVVTEPNIFWIKGYDGASANSITQLLESVRSYLADATPDLGKSCWIVESTDGIPGLQECCCELGPLNSPGITRILQRINSGGVFNDPEEAVRRAHGNPGLATRLWRSRSETAVKASDDKFTWFRTQLSKMENEMLSVLCFATHKSPLGTTVHVLNQLGVELYKAKGYLACEIESSVNSLVGKLEKRRLAQITRFDRRTFGGLLDELIPENISVIFVNSIATGLIENVLSSLSKEKQENWQEQFHRCLIDAAETNSLGYVTLALNWGDLEPFLRSSFRFTFARRILTWIDSTQWEAKDNRQEYILKALRIYAQNWSDPSITVEGELEEPKDDEVQRFVFALVQAKAKSRQKINTKSDLLSWLGEIQQCEDPELQAEMYVSTAMALPSSQLDYRFKLTWEILKNLLDKLEKHDFTSTARNLIIQETLAYLNRKKNIVGVVDHKQAYTMIQQHSRSLLETALRLENLQLICDALFYYVRSVELNDAEISYADLLRYLASLSFLEETQVKTIRHLQILLTQGTIHRHFCARKKTIQWEEFQQHMENGLEYYLRAFGSALANRHVVHVLNATAFIMKFCLQSLRFADNDNARPVIVEKSKKAIEYLQKVKEQVAPSIKRREEKNIFSSIQRSHAILLYVITVSAPDLNEEAREMLRCHFEHYTKQLVEKVEDGPIERKEVSEGLVNLYRALSFGQQSNQRNYEDLLLTLGPNLQTLLDGMARIAKSGQILRNWERLSLKLAPSTISLPVSA